VAVGKSLDIAVRKNRKRKRKNSRTASLALLVLRSGQNRRLPAALPPRPSRHISITIVTGPSFVRSTSMWAPKMPLATGTPSADRASQLKAVVQRHGLVRRSARASAQLPALWKRISRPANEAEPCRVPSAHSQRADAQGEILSLPRVERERETVSERQVREVVAEVGWGEQRKVWGNVKARAGV